MEYVTLVNCTKQLELALYKDRDIAHFLQKTGMISQETVINDPHFTSSHQRDVKERHLLYPPHAHCGWIDVRVLKMGRCV